MSSSVREALQGYLAGRVKAEGVVAAVGMAYYGEGSREKGKARREMRDGLQPLVAVIERAAPGVVELGGTASRPGFQVRLAERPFPKQFEAELRRAAEAVLQTDWERGKREGGRVEPARPGLVVRIIEAIGSLLRRE